MLATGKVSLDDTRGDKKGPITIGAAAAAASASAATPAPESKPLDPEAPKPETRVAVVGDSDFAANAFARHSGQPRHVHEHLGWLSQQENLIAIRPKDPEDRRITLTDTQQRNIIWLSLLVIPACIFGAGAYSWARRRR